MSKLTCSDCGWLDLNDSTMWSDGPRYMCRLFYDRRALDHQECESRRMFRILLNECHKQRDRARRAEVDYKKMLAEWESAQILITDCFAAAGWPNGLAGFPEGENLVDVIKNLAKKARVERFVRAYIQGECPPDQDTAMKCDQQQSCIICWQVWFEEQLPKKPREET